MPIVHQSRAAGCPSTTKPAQVASERFSAPLRNQLFDDQARTRLDLRQGELRGRDKECGQSEGRRTPFNESYHALCGHATPDRPCPGDHRNRAVGFGGQAAAKTVP